MEQKQQVSDGVSAPSPCAPQNAVQNKEKTGGAETKGTPTVQLLSENPGR